MTDMDKLMTKSKFPLSGKYPHHWIFENQMGPNVLWLAEWLSKRLKIEPDARVLDLGCGKGVSSIFFAKEFGARVWAADWWIGPDNNWRRVRESQVEDLICPVRAEAHALPFAKDFFDTIVSLDAYQYFGTDTLYLSYLANFIKEEGQIGVVVPSLLAPFQNGVPDHLAKPQANGHAFWEESCWCFKSPDWWASHWNRCEQVTDVKAEVLPDGWRHWHDFEIALEASGKNIFPSVAEALEKDAGRYIGFARVTATRNNVPAENLNDPAIGIRFGVDR